MKTIQLDLSLPQGFIHRYQVLDALFDAEEAHQDTIKAHKLSNLETITKNNKPSQELAHHYRLPSANPYSRISAEIESAPLVESSLPQVKISAGYFKREATRILHQYSPSVGKRRILRSEFRTFVDTNVTKPPTSRAQILSELRKYDLSASGFAEPLFNRELSDRVVNKLLHIGNH